MFLNNIGLGWIKKLVGQYWTSRHLFSVSSRLAITRSVIRTPRVVKLNCLLLHELELMVLLLTNFSVVKHRVISSIKSMLYISVCRNGVGWVILIDVVSVIVPTDRCRSCFSSSTLVSLGFPNSLLSVTERFTRFVLKVHAHLPTFYWRYLPTERFVLEETVYLLYCT